MCISALGTVTKTWRETGLPMAEVALEGRLLSVSALYLPDVEVGADVIVTLNHIVEVLDAGYAREVRQTRAEALQLKVRTGG